MKKIKILTFIFLVIFVCLITTKAFATSEDTKVYENLKYEINNNEVIITGYNGEPTDINIPSSIEEYPVTSISDFAFSNCRSLKNITFSNTLKKIGNKAFEWCTGLTSVTIPENITEFGENIFIWCSNISNVKLPSNLKTIPAGFLEGCTNLTNITIPKGVTKIDSGAFYETGLVDIVIPNSVTEIWYGAFGCCKDLKTVTIPSSVTFLGDDGEGDSIFFWDLEGTPLTDRITLYVEKDSYAQKYAQKNNIKYVVTNEEKETITAIIDIVDKEGETRAGAGSDWDLYSMIDVPTGLDYGDCYYQLYLKEYAGKTINVDGLGTFVFDKKDKVEYYGEPYIYKCKITNAEKFYKAGTNSYNCTYTIENTNQTYTTIIEIKVSGLEVKKYEVKSNDGITVNLTGTMEDSNLKVDNIEKENSTYLEMVTLLDVDKDNLDIYAYDISVDGEYEGKLTLTFDVGQEYNGRKAYILHRKKDLSIEKFEVVVVNGKATIEVTELSPFMVAIENSKQEQNTSENKKHILDNEPKTGYNISKEIGIALLVTTIAIAVVIRKNNK